MGLIWFFLAAWDVFKVGSFNRLAWGICNEWGKAKVDFGWKFWHFLENGKLVPIDELRVRYSGLYV